MKIFLREFIKVIGIFFALLYLGFLFILPHAVNLNSYKPEIQKLVTQYTGYSLNYGKLKIVTTPLLEVGIKADNVNISLPDNSELFTADIVKGKVFLPSILWLTVKVSGVDIVNPKLTAEILPDGEQFKAVRVYEDLVNAQRKDKLEHPEKYVSDYVSSEQPHIISKIRFNIQNINLKNYSVVVDDKSSGHKLSLSGKKLKAGCNNLKTAALKTFAKIYSDNDENILANIDINTFLPQFTPQEKEDDLEAVFAIPFVNPVTTYRNYNLKSNIDAKLKIRPNNHSGFVNLHGHLKVKDTQITVSGIELPKSNFLFKLKGDTVLFDTDLFVTQLDDIKAIGKIRHGKHPFLGFNVSSHRIYFDNLLNVLKAYLDAAQIKSGINDINASGFFILNAGLKTDFETLQSGGAFVVRDGNITDKNIGLIFNDIKASITLIDNAVRFKDTHLLVNGKSLDVSGKMNADSVTDLNIYADKLPLMGLYKAFAPKDIKTKYDLNSGYLSMDINATGKIRELFGIAKVDLDNFIVKDKTNLFTAINNNLRIGLVTGNGDFKGKIVNNGFNLNLPLIHSVIKNDNLTVSLNNEKITIPTSNIKFNNQSLIKFEGAAENWLKNPKIKLNTYGNIHTSDLGVLVGEIALPYFEKKGSIPIKAELNYNDKNLDVIAQAKADNMNYFTPVKMKDFENYQTLINVQIKQKGNTIKMEKSGLFVRPNNAKFTDNLAGNTLMSKNIVGVKSIISNINTQPFISLFKVDIPKPLTGSVAILPKSRFEVVADLNAHGKPQKPVLTGKVFAKNLIVPEISSKVDRLLLILGANDINVKVGNLDLGGTVFRLSAHTNWHDIMDRVFDQVRVSSNYIDVNKIIKFGDDVAAAFPNPKEIVENSSDSNLTLNIPLTVNSGNINFKKIKVDDKISLDNTLADIVLKDNVIYLNNLKTEPLGGFVSGKVSMNLVTSDLFAELAGKNFIVEKILLEVMDMKDMITGNMNFITGIHMSGTDIDTQMKTLQGYFDFNIKDGQLGPFGKIENMIMAENVRDNAFFSSAIGSIVTNLVTFDTSRYNELYGHLNFLGAGDVEISPIKSQGNVLSMYIAGKMNILDNSAEMKVRGKLASAFADKLGPLANINPINIVKNTPGLNIALVKAFALFCEEISEEEMKALPHLGEGKSDDNATKFQIRLKGNLNKPLAMIKSFKWLVLNSEMETAKNFVDTLPVPEPGEEGMSVEELIQLRKEQAEAKAAEEALKAKEEKKLINKIKRKFKIQK